MFMGMLRDYENDIDYFTARCEKISGVQKQAVRYIAHHKLDADYKFGDGGFKKVLLTIYRGKNIYAQYRYVPFYNTYDPHLVIRGGYWRKVK